MKKRFGAILTCVMALCCAVLLFGCDEVRDHRITATSWDIACGTVSGYGTYKTNYEVTLRATPKTDQNAFIAWIKDDEIVSYDAEFTFIASAETEGKYIAIFNGPDLELIALNNVQLSFGNVTTGTESSQVLTSISNARLAYGESASLLKTIATHSEVSVSSGAISAELNEFDFAQAVLRDTTAYTFEFSYTANYVNSVTNVTSSSNLVSPRVRIDFSQDAIDTENLTMTKSGSVINITIRNITTDWGSSGTLTLQFIEMSALEPPEAETEA